MTNLNKRIKEMMKKEEKFGQETLRINKSFVNSAKSKNELYDDVVVLEYYNLCQEYKSHQWSSLGREFHYRTELSAAIEYYTQYLSKDLYEPNTTMYKKHFTIDEEESVEENIDEIIELSKQGLECVEQALDIILGKELEIPNKEIAIEVLKNRKRWFLNKLSTIYRLYVNVEEGIKYAEEAAELNDKNAMQSLVYIYLREEYFNINLAKHYYQLLKELFLESEQTTLAFGYFGYYYRKNGLYKELEQHIKDYENNVLPGFRNFENKKTALKLLDEIKADLEKQKAQKTNHNVLNKYFPENILSKMEENIKVFITTSLDIKEYIDKENSSGKVLDYSGATMPAMKALENVLFEIFGRHYLDYLNSRKDNIDLSCIDDCFLYNRKQGTKELARQVNILEFGSILHLVGRIFFNDSSITNIVINKYFWDFCEEKCGIKNTRLFVSDFVEKLHRIKGKRNETAHKNRVYKEDAEEVNNYLLEQYEFIKFLYESFDMLF